MSEPKMVVPFANAGAGRAAPLVRRHGRHNGYAVAVMVVAIAFVLRFWLYGGLNNRLPFAFFLPAAMIAAWYGGLGPGMLAAAIGLLLGDYFFLPPHQSLGPLGETERTSVGVYALTAALGVILMGNLRSRIRSLECELAQRAAADRDVLPSSPVSDRGAVR